MNEKDLAKMWTDGSLIDEKALDRALADKETREMLEKIFGGE